MERVAERLQELHGYARVDVCHMEHASPSLTDTFQESVENGAHEIVVLPYFLHAGVHLTEDIPEMIQALRGRYPHVRVTVGPHLGFDDSLVDLVHNRIQQVTG